MNVIITSSLHYQNALKESVDFDPPDYIGMNITERVMLNKF